MCNINHTVGIYRKCIFVSTRSCSRMLSKQRSRCLLDPDIICRPHEVTCIVRGKRALWRSVVVGSRPPPESNQCSTDSRKSCLLRVQIFTRGKSTPVPSHSYIEGYMERRVSSSLTAVALPSWYRTFCPFTLKALIVWGNGVDGYRLWSPTSPRHHKILSDHWPIFI